MMANQTFFDDGEEPERERIRAMIAEEFAARVIRRTGGGTKQVLHAPRDPDPDADQPLCRSKTINGKWDNKSLLVYPRGHRDWCRRCLIRMFPEASNLEMGVTR